MSSLAEKNEIVEQLENAMEEAISEWRQADLEAVSFKQQLQASLGQKKYAEDHVACLDGAFKEYMRQVEQARESQEKKIRNVILRKSHEWDKMRVELKAKQSDLEQKVLQLGAENIAMSISLREHAKAIMEANETKAMAETEIKVLQAELESREKEISSLKYELHLLNKEVQNQNVRRLHSRKAADAAHNQHIENIKRTSMFESDSQRLHTRVHKKPSGPRVTCQMKREVHAVEKNMVDIKQMDINKWVPPRMQTYAEHSQQNMAKEIEMLKDQLLARDDEAKLLKEVLSNRTGELQAARRMCARTVHKLSIVEEKLESLHKHMNPDSSYGVINEISSSRSSLFSKSEDVTDYDEFNCAELWASALIAELSHFKDDKITESSWQVQYCNLDNIDSTLKEGWIEYPTAIPWNGGTIDTGNCKVQPSIQITKLLNFHIASYSKLEAADQTCLDVKGKLISIEEHLSMLESLTMANHKSLRQVQESLIKISEAHYQMSNLERILGEVQTAISSVKINTESPGRHSNRYINSNTLKRGNSLTEVEVTNSYSEMQSVSSILNSSVNSVICQIFQLAKSLVPQVEEGIQLGVLKWNNHRESEKKTHKAEHLASFGIEKKLMSFLTMKEMPVQNGNIDAIRFLLQFTFLLGCLLGIDPVDLECMSIESASSNSTKEIKKSVVPYSSEAEICSNLRHGTILEKSKDGNYHIQQNPCLDESKSSNVVLEAMTMASLQRDLIILKQEKAKLEQRLASAETEPHCTMSQLLQTQKALSDLQCQKTSLHENSKMEQEPAEMDMSKSESECQLKDADNNICQLPDNISSQITELEKQRKQFQNMVSRNAIASTQVSDMENNTTNSCRCEDSDQTKPRKDQEVSSREKLAECQQNVAFLGKQLRALISPQHSGDLPFGSTVEPVASQNNKIVPVVSDLESHPMEDIHVSSHSEIGEAAGSCGLGTRSNRRWDCVASKSDVSTGYGSHTTEAAYMAGHSPGNASSYPGDTHCGSSNHVCPDVEQDSNVHHSHIQALSDSSRSDPPGKKQPHQSIGRITLERYLQEPAQTATSDCVEASMHSRITSSVPAVATMSSKDEAASSSCSTAPTKLAATSTFRGFFSRRKHHHHQTIDSQQCQ